MPILLYSYSWFIYNFVILFLLFLICVNKKIKKSSYFIIFVFFIIFSVYGYITADYNSYLELMKMSKVNDPLVALEPIYVWYIQLISGNYFVFRLTLYIVSFIFLWGIFQYVRCYKLYFLILYSVILLYDMAGGRQMLSICMMFLGLFLILYEKIQLKKILFGLLLLISSSFFHKTGIYMLLFLLLLIMNINTKKILLLVCVIPVFVYFGNILIEEYLSDLLELEGGGYLMKEAQEGSFWWVVIMYIQVVVLYVLSFIVLYTLRKNILTCIDKVMYRFVFWIIYVSTIFYFLNIENNDIFLRWLNVVKIPMIYLLSKYVFNRFTYSCISMTNCFVLFLLFAFWFSTNIYIIGVSHINVK